MATRLTKKERGFVKEILKGKNGTEAALAAYDTDKPLTAASIASENLTKPKIVNAIHAALPDALLAKVHLEGLEAYKLGNGAMIGGEDGIEAIRTEEPDFATRHKYLDTAYKVKGSYAPDKHLNLNLESTIPSEELKGIAERLNELERRNT